LNRRERIVELLTDYQIRCWKQEAREMSTDELKEKVNALAILFDWDLFAREFVGIGTVTAIFSSELYDRILTHRD